MYRSIPSIVIKYESLLAWSMIVNMIDVVKIFLKKENPHL